jgi:hypothetical protein
VGPDLRLVPGDPRAGDARPSDRAPSGGILRWLVRGALGLFGFFVLESGFALLRETGGWPPLGPGAFAMAFVQAESLLVLVAWLVFRARDRRLTSVAILAVSAEWLTLGVLLEGLVGRLFRGLSWSEIWGRYRPSAGAESLVIAGSFLLVPLAVGLVCRRRGPAAAR